MNTQDDKRIGYGGIGKRVDDLCKISTEEINNILKHAKEKNTHEKGSDKQKEAVPKKGKKESPPLLDRHWHNVGSQYGWLIVVLFVIGFIAFISNPSPKPTPPPAPAPAPVPAPAPAPAPEKAPEKAPAPAPAPEKAPEKAPAPAPIPVTPFEQKPPVGKGLTFSTAQIRYCVYEKVRVEAMRDIIDSNFQVAIFNQYVDDYNSRCSSYRYRRGSLQSVQSELTSETMSMLRREGRSRIR